MQLNQNSLHSVQLKHQSGTAYQFYIRNIQLEIVSTFKYLGIIFSANETFNTAVSTLAVGKFNANLIFSSSGQDINDGIPRPHKHIHN